MSIQQRAALVVAQVMAPDLDGENKARLLDWLLRYF